MRAGSWQRRNLARLHRSLEKIKRLDERTHFSGQDWNRLLSAYFDATGLA
jgi:hypothetical protein